jgi:hypothetical protein
MTRSSGATSSLMKYAQRRRQSRCAVAGCRASAVLHPLPGGARRNGPGAVRIDRERERLGVDVVVVRVEHELVIGGVRAGAVPEQLQAPPGEDTCRRHHVRLGVVADPEGEELEDLAPEIFLRPRPRVEAAVEPDEHRGIARHLDQQLAEVADGEPPELLVLPHLRARHFVGTGRHHLRAVHRAERAVDLRIRGGEVVVPEQRHLLLQRTAAVDHAKQLALTGVVDDRVRCELAARRDRNVFRLVDVAIHVVRLLLVIQQELDDVRRRPSGEAREVLAAGAERNAPQDVFERAISSGHVVA